MGKSTIQLAVEARRVEGASDAEILQECIEALKHKT